MASTTRESILQAADELFGEFGFEGATTRQIAQRSGANKALIHYHFQNKGALFIAVLDRYYERLTGLLIEAVEGQGTLRERFVHLVDVYVDFLQHNSSFSRIVQREAAGGQHVDRIVSHMTPLLRAGVGVLRDAFPDAFEDDIAAAQVLISFHGIIINYFTYGPVLAPFLRFAPDGRKGRALRKRHLDRMVHLFVTEFEGDAP